MKYEQLQGGGGDMDYTNYFYGTFGGEQLIVMEDVNDLMQQGDVVRISNSHVVTEFVNSPGSYVDIIVEECYDLLLWEQVGLKLDFEKYSGTRNLGGVKDIVQLYYLVELCEQGKLKFVNEHRKMLRMLEDFLGYLEEDCEEEG